MMYLFALISILIGSTTAWIELLPSSLNHEFVQTDTDEMILTIESGLSGTVSGLPDIPSLPRWIELDQNTRAVSLTAGNCTWEPLEERPAIRPLPEPCIISRPVQETAAVRSEVYSINDFWPSEPVTLSGTGYRNDLPCAELVVTPFRYNPVTHEIQRLVSVEVVIETEPVSRRLPQVDSAGFERLLIVTDQSIREPFDSLAAWRTAEGILTEVVTTDVIFTSPSGDNAELLRNFIIDYRAQNGLDHVLLGGDTNFIPCRFAYPMSYEWNGGREDNMPCDLYYSDLDGTWNLDGDTIWGEVADSVDLYPDVNVGRAPCENLDEAWVFWNKIKAYETDTDLGHLDATVLAAGVLWSDPFTDDADVKKYIKNNHIPEWFSHTELYTTSGNYTTNSVIAALDQGAGYVNLNDHGWTGSVGCLDNNDVDQVNSSGKFFGMMYSIGCWTSAFDYDCVSEHFLNNPLGCGVSYIGNSSYGWGSPGNPLFGYSDRFDRELFRILFDDPTLNLGELVSAAKELYMPFANQENCYRCVLYMVNLLGDPTLRTFRRNPVTPLLDLPDFVTQNTGSVPVTVDIPGSYLPEEVAVCIHDEDMTNYQVEYLDGSGFALIDLDSPPQGDVTVTVTGTDVKRTTVTIPQATGPLPVITAVDVSTTEGYTNPAPGTEAMTELTLTNQGTESLSAVTLTATLTEGPGTLTQNQISFGALSPGESSTGSQSLSILVDENAVTGQMLKLQISISADQGSWTSQLPLLVYAPGLYFSSYSVDDSAGGNGNGYAEPGESFQLVVDIANTGLLVADDVSASVSSTEPWLIWTADSAFVPEIPSDGTGQFSFSGEVSQSAPDTAFPIISLATSATPEWSASEDFMMVTGEFFVSDDFENGANGWTHTGTGDSWHLSTAETHSGSWAWWCGDETSGSYQPGMSCALLSPYMVLAPDAELSFWSCFEVDLYGADGLYVIVNNLDEMSSDTLDFIGAGGLLGLKTLLADGNMMWLPRSYDLSEYAPGTSVQIELAFFTDTTDPNLGAFHIDDVTVDGYADLAGTGSPQYPDILGLPCPNPSTGAFSIPVNVQQGSWTLDVYDLSGRLVHRTSALNPYLGSLSMNLQGIPAGVYIISVRTEDETLSRKAVITN